MAVLIPGLSSASVTTVPDNYPTIQAAIDVGADTVFVRSGEYAEIPFAPRGVTILGLGSQRPRLAGLAIANLNSPASWAWLVEDVDIAGPVSISTPNYQERLLNMSFVRCRLSGGIQHDQATSSDPYDILDFSVVNCHLGAASLGRSARLVMHADTVDAGISWGVVEHVSVDRSWFQGGSPEALRLWGEVGIGQVESNVFENAGKGLAITNCDQVTIRSNVVRHMSGTGMEVWGTSGLLEHNSIQDCGTGIWSACDGITLSHNSCVRIRDVAAYFLLPEGIVAEWNVIGDCGSDAIFIQSPFMANITFNQNTIYRAGGSGLVIADGGDNTLALEANIISGSRGFGLHVATTLLADTLRCNDWFGNVLGDVTGVPASDSDLALDPGFCDVADDSVSLYSDSPLVGRSACMQIGARGVGCSPPTLGGMDVGSIQAGLRVRWTFPTPTPSGGWVERAEQLGSPWDSLGTGTGSGNSFEFVDAAVAPNREYHYRVAWKDRGAVVRGSPVMGTWVDAGRLTSVAPNPMSDDLKVEWVLAQPGRTDIRVFDLAGREVAVVANGAYDVGRHQVRWDGRSQAHGPAAAGMYIVRIVSAERTTSHSVLLLR